jgi:hypothetical protein
VSIYDLKKRLKPKRMPKSLLWVPLNILPIASSTKTK